MSTFEKSGMDHVEGSLRGATRMMEESGHLIVTSFYQGYEMVLFLCISFASLVSYRSLISFIGLNVSIIPAPKLPNL